MPTYRYQAISAAGDLLRGEMEALSQQAVVDRLHWQGHVAISAEEAGKWSVLRFLRRPTAIDGRRSAAVSLVLLTQQLGTLLHAGLALDRALEIALDGIVRKADRACVSDVLNKIRGGSSLADAMAAQTGVFPSFYIGIVRAGEAGGSLDATLTQLGEFLERSQSTRAQVKSALLYPAIVLATGCLSITILFAFVIPRFRPLIEGSGTRLPFLAEAVFALSDAWRDYWWVFLAVIGATILFARRYMRNPESRRRWSGRILQLPLIGDLVTKMEVARFSLTLGTLLRNGVAPLAALAITREAIGNAALREALDTVSESVKEGKGLANPLSQCPFMPRLVIQLTRVGEETGRLDEMLLKVASIYDQETRRSIDRSVALLVPGVILALGGVVALVVGAMMSAILAVYDQAI